MKHTCFSIYILAAAVLWSAGGPPVSADQPSISYEMTSRLVQVPTIVLDKQGAPVMGLTAADFRLREDGVEQEIAAFEEVKSAAPADSQPAVEHAGNPPDIPRAGRTLAVLMDQQTTSPRQLRAAFEGVMDLVKDGMRPGDQIALFSYHSDLEILRGFTQNREELLAFLDTFQQQFRVGRLVQWPKGGAITASDPGLPPLTSFKSGPVPGPDIVDHLYRSLIAIAEALRPIDGPKELFLLSTGYIDSENRGLSHHKDLDRALADSQTFLSVVDTMGPVIQPADGGRTALLNFQRQSDLARFADIGNGSFSPEPSNIGNALVQARERFTHYYVLAYYPNEPQLKRDFHEITVTVPDKKDAKVIARTGYSDQKTIK